MAAMEKTLDRFTVFFGVKVDAKQLRKLETGLDRVQGGLKRMQGGLRRMAMASAAGVASIGGVAAGLLRMAGNFDEQMRAMAAATGLPFTRVQGLAVETKRIMADYGRTSEEVWAGMTKSFSGGSFTQAQHIEIVERSARLAAAGFGDMATTISAATTLMGTYGATADEAFTAIVAAGQGSDAALEQMAPALKRSSGYAKSMGIGIVAQATELSQLSTQLDMEEATTSYIGFLSALSQKPTAQAESLFKELTGREWTDMYEMVQEAGKLTPVLELLRDATGGDALKLAALFPNLRGRQGAEKLIGLLPELVVAHEKNSEALAKGGADILEYAKVSEGFNNQMRILKANLGLLGVEIGDRLMPVVLDWIQGMKAVVGWMRTGELNLDDLSSGAAIAAMQIKGMVEKLEGVGRALNIIDEEEGFADLVENVIRLVPEIANIGIFAAKLWLVVTALRAITTATHGFIAAKAGLAALAGVKGFGLVGAAIAGLLTPLGAVIGATGLLIGSVYAIRRAELEAATEQAQKKPLQLFLSGRAEEIYAESTKAHPEVKRQEGESDEDFQARVDARETALRLAREAADAQALSEANAILDSEWRLDPAFDAKKEKFVGDIADNIIDHERAVRRKRLAGEGPSADRLPEIYRIDMSEESWEAFRRAELIAENAEKWTRDNPAWRTITDVPAPFLPFWEAHLERTGAEDREAGPAGWHRGWLPGADEMPTDRTGRSLGFTPPLPPLPPVAAASGASSVTVGAINVEVTADPGMNEQDLAAKTGMAVADTIASTQENFRRNDF